jgi:hypothetical protein
MKGLIGSIVSRVARLDPCSPDLYYARFMGGLMVQINAIDAGPLTVGTSGVEGEDAQPPAGTLQDTDELPIPGPRSAPVRGTTTGGLWLSISKTTDAPVVVMCALSPFPPALPRKFTMVAHGRLGALEPDQLGDLWGVAVGARNSDNLGDPNSTLAGASIQVRNLGGLVPGDFSTGPQVALGAGNGPDPGSVTPPVTDDLTPPSIAFPDPADLSFTLETDIDCNLGLGRSRLRTPGKAWPERQWTFKNFVQVTGVGFSLAMVSKRGRGRPGVWIHDFGIYRYRYWSKWWYFLCHNVIRVLFGWSRTVEASRVNR